MATTRKTTNTSAAVGKAKTARIAAEQKHAESTQAHADAQAKLASLHEALAQGDASITGEALIRAEQEITRAGLLAGAASKELAEAVAIEQEAIAVQVAEELPERLDRVTKRSTQHEAQAALTNALTTLVRAVNDDHQAIRHAVAEARAAGLIAGRCDPLFPAIAGKERVGVISTRDYIEIYGTRYVETPAVETVEAVLGEALNAAGIDLTTARK